MNADSNATPLPASAAIPAHDPTLVGLHAEIIRAFHFFNALHWAEKPLPIPVFSFFPQPPKGSRLGHFWAGTWQDGEERRSEIIFYADLCLQAGITQVIQTLLHEMVHLWQQEQGKPGKGNHHNREWHAECARVGLITEGPKGYTKPGEGFTAALAKLAPSQDAIPFRAVAGRRKGKMILWTCQCVPVVKLRIGRSDVDITCNRCESVFERQG